MPAKNLSHLARLIADDAHAASFQSLGQYRSALLKEIAEASAATEQEAVAWGAFYFGGKKHGQLYNHSDTRDQIEQYIIQVERSDDSISLTSGPLYTHPSAEIERLRADANEAEQKLAEAKALLREVAHAYRTTTCSVYKILPRVDVFLSATAQTAEVKS